MTPRVHIACFHRIVQDGEEEREWPYLTRGTALTLSQFKQRLDALATDFDIIDEKFATRILDKNEPGPANACWITFDDGYQDTLTLAAPVLTEYGIKPTLFLTTRLLAGNWFLPVDRWYSILLNATRRCGEFGHGNNAWEFDLDKETDRERFVNGEEKQRFINGTILEQERALEQLTNTFESNSQYPKMEYLCREDLSTLTDLGWFVGPHGHTHQILPKCSEAELVNEVMSSLSILGKLSIKRSRWFSYSDGVVDSRVQAILEPHGYLGALRTEGRLADPTDDSWEMPRFIECPRCATQTR